MFSLRHWGHLRINAVRIMSLRRARRGDARRGVLRETMQLNPHFAFHIFSHPPPTPQPPVPIAPGASPRSGWLALPTLVLRTAKVRVREPRPLVNPMTLERAPVKAVKAAT